MKTKFFFVMLASSIPLMAGAQALSLSAGSTNSAPPAAGADANLQKQLPAAMATVGQTQIPIDELSVARPRVDGALVRASRKGQPWQAINPFAPPEFGQWYENVSVEPHTRQPAGIVLLSFRIGSHSRQ